MHGGRLHQRAQLVHFNRRGLVRVANGSRRHERGQINRAGRRPGGHAERIVAGARRAMRIARHEWRRNACNRGG